MRNASGRLAAMAALVLIGSGAGPGDGPVAKANPRPPEQVLKEAGLTRQGHCYVLEGERQAGQLMQDFNLHAARLSVELDREAAVAADYQFKEMEAAGLQQRANLDRQAAHMLGRRSRGAARSEDRQAYVLGREASNLRRNASRQDGQQMRKLEQAASADQKALTQDQAKYQATVFSTLRRYAELADRPEIQQALREVNRGEHPKFTLGPMGAYKARVEHAMVLQLAEKGLRVPKAGVAEPVEARPLVRQAEDLNVRSRALDKAGEPADSPGRAALARDAAALSTKFDDLERRCAELADDEDVRDALEELMLQSKAPHLRVGLGLDAQHARKILDAIGAAPAPADGPMP